MPGEKNTSVFPPRQDQTSNDNSKFVVALGKFNRPRLFIVGGYEFIFPGGIEGMDLYGNATLSEHRYIGWGYLSVQTTHRDSSRIDLNGNFPGRTGVQNVAALRYLLTAPDPADFKRLELPGIFNQAQKVVTDNYRFSRIEGDSFGFSYQVTLVRVGLGDVVNLATANSNPTVGPNEQDRGQGRTFAVRSGARTLKQLAKTLYGDPNKWRQIYEMNKYTLEKFFNGQQLVYPMEAIAMTPLPIGMSITY